MIEYADVSSAALLFHLLAGRPNLSDLQPIKTNAAKIRCGPHELQCEVGILGASHYFMVEWSGRLLTEVLVCKEVPTDGRRLFCGPLGLGGRIGPFQEEFGQFDYTFRAWSQTWSGDTARDVDRMRQQVEAANGCGQIGLQFEFPSSGEGPQKEQRPETVVYLAANQILVVETVHSYPNEDMVVFTKSEISTKGDPK